MSASRLRVVIADDERPARSFGRRPSSVPDVAIVGEAANGAEAIQLIERHRPDVALLDVQMPEVDGLSVVRLLRRRLSAPGDLRDGVRRASPSRRSR